MKHPTLTSRAGSGTRYILSGVGLVFQSFPSSSPVVVARQKSPAYRIEMTLENSYFQTFVNFLHMHELRFQVASSPILIYATGGLLGFSSSVYWRLAPLNISTLIVSCPVLSLVSGCWSPYVVRWFASSFQKPICSWGEFSFELVMN